VAGEYDEVAAAADTRRDGHSPPPTTRPQPAARARQSEVVVADGGGCRTQSVTKTVRISRNSRQGAVQRESCQCPRLAASWRSAEAKSLCPCFPQLCLS